ncbi:MAG: hypothetical protein IJ832_06140 [Bacteroidaceae bacterium]|nr:hypothetical protein [Bacteroidaceae bacterium]
MENVFNLEEMRQQMTILKNKLEKQEIISDRMLRKAMKKNIVDINRRYLIIATVGLLMIPYGYWAFVMMGGMSIGFWLVCSFGMVVSFCYTLWNGKDLRDKHLLETDILTARKKVARAKKRDHEWLKFGIPFGILFIIYFAYEAYRLYGAEGEWHMLIVGVICGLIGCAVGVKLHFSTQRKYQDIIDQIDDLTTD